ncbi:MAG: hypothetical protein HY037_00200 [Nitrospirae bacterium]|nr:hypothetical protein [Candidatus Troglogloeales bacterium]
MLKSQHKAHIGKFQFRLALLGLTVFTLLVWEQGFGEQNLFAQSLDDAMKKLLPEEQGSDKQNYEISVGIGSWLSTGGTIWSHDASFIDPLLGNPTSELNYKNISSNIVELHSELLLTQKQFIRINYGFGEITGGSLIDDDYFSKTGAEAFTNLDFPHRFSRTSNDISGSELWYVNADLGYDAWSFLKEQGYSRAFFGYQYWTEKVETEGVTTIECTLVGDPDPCNPIGTVTNVGQTVITNTVKWISLRLGLESRYQFTSRFSLDGSVIWIQYTSMKNEDIHHLRDSLQQNPSFSMSGTGMGVNTEIAGKLMITQNLFFNVGYRYWWVRVTDGTLQGYPVKEASFIANLNELQSVRQGVTLGLDYKF